MTVSGGDGPGVRVAVRVWGSRGVLGVRVAVVGGDGLALRVPELNFDSRAAVVESVDTMPSKGIVRMDVWVRVPPAAPPARAR